LRLEDVHTQQGGAVRKLFWQISVTLDGFMEGANCELDDTAGVVDPDFDRYVLAMLQSIDSIVLGRKTYQLFVDYWPKATGADAERMNNLPKIVFSRTLAEVGWNNTRLDTGDLADGIAGLKQQPGRDIALFGSANLAAALLRHQLIDEYRIFVSPVLLGRGNAAFTDLRERTSLKLLRAETWSSGIVALFYGVGSRA
jgi:dihydrofolate reductase